MARVLEKAVFYIKGDTEQSLTDGETANEGATGCLVKYDVVDGNAMKSDHFVVSAPDWTKIFHNTGAVGEFVRDVIDEIKTAESIA